MSSAVLVAPACLSVPPGRVGSFVDDVAEIGVRLGRPPEPEQLLAMDALTAYDRRGRFLSVEAGVEGPRQSTGKTGGIMLPVVLWTALTDPDLVTWTSHLSDTHLASFRELAGLGPKDDGGLIASCDWLRRRVHSVSYENNAESVSFRGPQGVSTVEFRCRSARRGRGRSGATVFNDESQMLDGESMGALLPTLATRSLHGNARAYYAGSAPLRSSAYLRSLRRRAAAGDPTLTYVGWWARGSWADPGCSTDGCQHAVDTEGCALDDEALWAEANILLGRRTSLEFLRTMRRTLPPLEFGREFLGWGEDGDDAVDVDRWGLLADPQSRPLERPVVWAVEVAPGGRSAAVLAAGRRADGLVHVELLEHAPGVDWLAPFLVAKQASLDGAPLRFRGGRTPVASVLPGLVAAGVRVEPMPEAEVAAGCGVLDELLRTAGLRHLGDPRLAAALGVVVRRVVGDGAWLMTWRGSMGDASPAMALPVALRALMTAADVDYPISESIG